MTRIRSTALRHALECPEAYRLWADEARSWSDIYGEGVVFHSALHAAGVAAQKKGATLTYREWSDVLRRTRESILAAGGVRWYTRFSPLQPWQVVAGCALADEWIAGRVSELSPGAQYELHVEAEGPEGHTLVGLLDRVDVEVDFAGGVSVASTDYKTSRNVSADGKNADFRELLTPQRDIQAFLAAKIGREYVAAGTGGAETLERVTVVVEMVRSGQSYAREYVPGSEEWDDLNARLSEHCAAFTRALERDARPGPQCFNCDFLHACSLPWREWETGDIVAPDEDSRAEELASWWVLHAPAVEAAQRRLKSLTRHRPLVIEGSGYQVGYSSSQRATVRASAAELAALWSGAEPAKSAPVGEVALGIFEALGGVSVFQLRKLAAAVKADASGLEGVTLRRSWGATRIEDEEELDAE